MSIQSALASFRWSLYVVKNDKDIAYAMHENSVLRIVGYTMSYFANGASPVAPWSLYLNFNKEHKALKLQHGHFTSDGEDITDKLRLEIESIDPGWRVKGGEPVFEEAATRNRLNISEHAPGKLDIAQMLMNVDKSSEVTFFSLMNEVFQKK